MNHTILRLPNTKSESGNSRSTIYLRMDQGLWTKQVKLGPRAVGWPAHEVAALNAARIAGKTDDEIRALVVKLHAARKNAALPADVQHPVKLARVPKAGKAAPADAGNVGEVA